jgi:hypothetical protein
MQIGGKGTENVLTSMVKLGKKLKYKDKNLKIHLFIPLLGMG